MKTIKKLTEKIASIALAVSSISILAALIVVTLDVTFRYIFQTPISGAMEIISFYCMIPIIFLPLLKLELEDGHIVTDLFFGKFTFRVQSILWLIRCLIGIIIFGFLAWFTFEQAVRSTSRGEIAMGISQLPIWPARWILPISFFLAALGAALSMINHIKGK